MKSNIYKYVSTKKDMKIEFILMGFLFLGIFVVLFSINPPSTEDNVTPQEEIETAIKSYQLSSLGWRDTQDQTAATLSTQMYINSKLKEIDNGK